MQEFLLWIIIGLIILGLTLYVLWYITARGTGIVYMAAMPAFVKPFLKSSKPGKKGMTFNIVVIVIGVIVGTIVVSVLLALFLGEGGGTISEVFYRLLEIFI